MEKQPMNQEQIITARSFRELRGRDFLAALRRLSWEDPASFDRIAHDFDPNTLRNDGVRDLSPDYCESGGIFGEKYRVNLNDHIGWNIFLKGYYDPIPVIFALMLQRVGFSGCYIDAGANIGSTSIPVAANGIEVLAVEASPSTAAELTCNVGLNSPIPVTVVNAALGSPEQMAAGKFVRLYKNEGNFAAGSLVAGWNTSDTNRFEEITRLVTLDGLCETFRTDRILCLKMDIEGSEVEALKGFGKTLAQLAPPVVFEWRPDLIYKTFGFVPNITKIFPSNYRFFQMHQYVQDGGPSGGKRHFGIHLDGFAVTQPHDSVLAISEEQYQSSGIFRDMTAATVTIDI